MGNGSGGRLWQRVKRRDRSLGAQGRGHAGALISALQALGKRRVTTLTLAAASRRSLRAVALDRRKPGSVAEPRGLPNTPRIRHPLG